MKALKWVEVGAVLLFTAACTTTRPPVLDRVESELDLARMNPIYSTSEAAQMALNDAEADYRRADREWRERRNWDETRHLARLAEQKLEIADLTARRDQAAASRARLAPDYMASDDLSRLARELPDFRVRRTPRGLQITVADAAFIPSSGTLRSGAAGSLAPLAVYLRERPSAAVTVEGHSDTSDFAMARSLERADAVRNSLISLAVPSGRILARGLGNQYPLTSNATEAGRTTNRRVEIYVTSTAYQP